MFYLIEQVVYYLHCIVFYFKRDSFNKMDKDPNEARYLRKQYADKGEDQQEEEEDKQFNSNFEEALKHHSKNAITKNIRQQVQYFGSAIEPFNMRDQQQMGEMDQNGFFVFKRQNQYRDAWLDSIQEGNDMMVADKIKKKIKTEGGRFQTVYEGQQKINQDYRQQMPSEEQENQQGDEDEGPNEQQQEQDQKQQQFTAKQLKQLLVQLLPQNKSANNYLKQLKKNLKNQQNKQLHDKILQICNKYIQMTDEYDILTLKKQQLQTQFDNEKSQELNWDSENQKEIIQDKFENKEQKQVKNKLNANPQKENSNFNNQEENDDIF